jgi:predicted DNA binding CopG/RHH family protein
MRLPIPIPRPRRVQEEIETETSGHCINPFTPLWSGEPCLESSLASSLYSIAREIDEDGLDGDYLNQLGDIAHNLKIKICSWYEIGLKAWKVKLFKAWRKEYRSFKEFCETAIGRSSGAVNAWIRSARVMSNLIAMGFERLPLSASIALELSRFDRTDLEEAWSYLCDEFSDHEMTLEKVKTFLADPTKKQPQWANTRLPAPLMEKLRKRANSLGIPISTLIEELLGNDESLDENDENPTDIESDGDDEPHFAQRVKCGFTYDYDEYYNHSMPVNSPKSYPEYYENRGLPIPLQVRLNIPHDAIEFYRQRGKPLPDSFSPYLPF